MIGQRYIKHIQTKYTKNISNISKIFKINTKYETAAGPAQAGGRLVFCIILDISDISDIFLVAHFLRFHFVKCMLANRNQFVKRYARFRSIEAV